VFTLLARQYPISFRWVLARPYVAGVPTAFDGWGMDYSISNRLDGRKLTELSLLGEVTVLTMDDGTRLSIYSPVSISGTSHSAFTSDAVLSESQGTVTAEFGSLSLSFNLDVPSAGPETAQMALADGTIVIFP
jgi:hypothetical protein